MDNKRNICKTKKDYNSLMKQALSSDMYNSESGTAFTHWRMSGVQMNYTKLVKLGNSGARKEIIEKQNFVDKTSDTRYIYRAMQIALDTFADICIFYTRQALQLAQKSHGVTAFLNSVLKPPIDMQAGAVQNMKFSKEMFTDYRDKLEILLHTYWQKGGSQAMITVIGRGDLEAAMEHPELYQNLIVRVGGFSERFVNLPRHTQFEILSRTLY